MLAKGGVIVTFSLPAKHDVIELRKEYGGWLWTNVWLWWALSFC